MKEINDEKLDEIFDLQDIEDQTKEIRETLMKISDGDPDEIIKENVDRANRILDKVENLILDGGRIEARMVEVAAKLIDSVTQAANSLIGESFNTEKMQLNAKSLQLKELELQLKARNIEKNGKSHIVDDNGNNVYITDRETVIKMFNDMKEKEKESLQSE